MIRKYSMLSSNGKYFVLSMQSLHFKASNKKKKKTILAVVFENITETTIFLEVFFRTQIGVEKIKIFHS